MKSLKLSLLAISAMALGVFSSTAAANADMDFLPYLKPVAEEYLVPYLSRDLEKDVKVKIDPYETNIAKLDLEIPNATCDDYILSLTIMKARLFVYEFIAELLEKDKSLTMEKLTEPMSTLNLFQTAESAIGAGIITNPKLLVCNSTDITKEPRFLKIMERFKDNVAPRLKKLEEEGRIKNNLGE